ncbi:UNVERIFIED_CONTAM: hypothetical protein GTU68_061092 [Idotea baltica]|nr:hypothetical protein [Idotea baltica]
MSSDSKDLPVKEQVKSVPEDPGVYRYFDQKGKLLYIGKAKNLKKRVKSYFTKQKGHSYRIATMVNQIASIKYTVVNNEVEALTLENNLIKEFQPKYNILLKDGKTYPYICIKKERFPRVFPTRNKIKDGSEYYGPFTFVKTMYAFLELVRKNYQLRTCNYNLSPANIAAEKFKICLEYQIGNCLGPCEGKQTEADYNLGIEAIRKILKGQIKPLLRSLTEEMQTAAGGMEFELAEKLRVQIERIGAYKRRNTIASETMPDAEILTVDRLNDLAIMNHFKVVNGSIIATHTYESRVKNSETDEELLEVAFEKLEQEEDELNPLIFSNVTFVPPGEENNYKVSVPQRGEKRKLVDLSLKNCRTLLEEKVLKQNFRKNPQDNILEQMQKDLSMKKLPRHIECFDNSNIQGEYPVASMVVFKDGKPAKKDYRHFKIKTVVGPDDFASMEEIVYRRYKRLLDEQQPLPDLIVIDGGKGQLSSAANSLRELDLIGTIPIIGIAKKLEEIFHLGDPIPLHLDKRSTSLKIIQQLRNEAHRFAITFHRDLRSKNTFKSKLTSIEGIGEGTRKKLLSHFRSVKKIKEASLEELTEVIGPSKAKMVIKAKEKGQL